MNAIKRHWRTQVFAYTETVAAAAAAAVAAAAAAAAAVAAAAAEGFGFVCLLQGGFGLPQSERRRCKVKTTK